MAASTSSARSSTVLATWSNPQPTERLTTDCRAVTAWAATTMASMAWWGAAACPPRPVITALKNVGDAKNGRHPYYLLDINTRSAFNGLAYVNPKLEVRVIGRAEGSRIQSAHLTPDGRLVIGAHGDFNGPLGPHDHLAELVPRTAE